MMRVPVTAALLAGAVALALHAAAWGAKPCKKRGHYMPVELDRELKWAGQKVLKCSH